MTSTTKWMRRNRCTTSHLELSRRFLVTPGSLDDLKSLVAERTVVEAVEMEAFEPERGLRARLTTSAQTVAYAFGQGLASVITVATARSSNCASRFPPRSSGHLLARIGASPRATIDTDLLMSQLRFGEEETTHCGAGVQSM